MRKVTLATVFMLCATTVVACSSPSPLQDPPAGTGANDSRSRGGPARGATQNGSSKDQLEEQRSQQQRITVDDAAYAKFEQEAMATYANAPPPTDGDGVPIAKRAVIVVNDSTTDSPDPAKFRLIDKGMKLLFDLGLKNGYGKVVYLGEGQATWAAFVDNVSRLAKDPSVSVIDAMINLHGAPGALGFNDQLVETQKIADDLVKAVPDDVFYKLRIAYNQACFGESHSAGFLGGGFLTAVGTKGVHSSGIVDWPTFVSTWGGGGTIEQSITRGTAATLVELASRWFGGDSDVDNGWLLDGTPDVSVGTPLLPATK